MFIKEIDKKETWEHFLSGCGEKTFLQSWNWGEFNKMMGSKILRLGVYDGDDLVSVALTVLTRARRGTFLLVPHGPNIKFKNKEQKLKTLEVLLNKLKETGKGERADFIRINPIWERNEENDDIFSKLGFKKAPIHMHPEASWKLDIKPSEEELLMQMRKTTRYLIRQAQKNKDLEIFHSQKLEDLEVFNKIYQEVVKEHRFIPFSSNYLKNEFLAFKPDNQISLFFGKYKGNIIASAFIIFWSNIGFYHHAALSPQYHKIPMAYLLQWEAIKEAKKRGCILYDFWGYVSPQDNPEHPWAGPTQFKMGFAGYKKEYVKTQDFVFSRRYWLTYIFEKLRKVKRGL